MLMTMNRRRARLHSSDGGTQTSVRSVDLLGQQVYYLQPEGGPLIKKPKSCGIAGRIGGPRIEL